jgi:hypothetical protein
LPLCQANHSEFLTRRLFQKSYNAKNIRDFG